MRRTFFFHSSLCLALAMVVTVVVGPLGVAAKTVLPVTDAESLDAAIGRAEIGLVAFVRSEGCPLCDLLLKELESAGDFIDAAVGGPAAHGGDSKVRIASAVVERSNELALRYGVGTFPMLRLFSRGVELNHPYRGGYTAVEIAQYLRELTEDPSTYLETLADAKAIVPAKDGSGIDNAGDNDGRITLFGFFKLVNRDLDALRKVERELRSTGFFRFVHASTDEVSNFYGHRHTFAVYHPGRPVGNGRVAVWPADEAIDPERAMTFVAEHALPLAGHLSGSNAFLYRRVTSKPVVRLYLPDADATDQDDVAAAAGFATWPEARAAIVRRLEGVAAAEPRAVFVTAPLDWGQGEAGEDLRALGFSAGCVRRGTAFAVFQNGRKYRPDADPAGVTFDADALQAYVADFFSQPPLPFLTSEPRPDASSQTGAVVTVVGRTFHDVVVHDESKLAVVLLHAPWCGHCKELLPMWRQLADEIAADVDGAFGGRVVVCQMDATKNELPRGYTVSSYPTVYAALPGEKLAPREYDGERSLDAYKAYIGGLLKNMKKQ